MNASIVRESLHRLRDQRRQNNDIIRESQKTNANLQTNTDQLSLQYDQEECQRRKMQEALRLSVNELDCISEDIKNILWVTEEMKIQLDRFGQQEEDLATDSKQQMRLWETECHELASEFQQGYKLYLNQFAVQDDQQKLSERCQKLETAIATINKDEQDLISADNSAIDEFSPFLQLDPAASRVFEVFHVDQAKTEALRLQLENLKAVANSKFRQACK